MLNLNSHPYKVLYAAFRDVVATDLLNPGYPLLQYHNLLLAVKVQVSLHGSSRFSPLF